MPSKNRTTASSEGSIITPINYYFALFFPIENNRLSGDVPSGTGRLCEWREDPQQPADKFSSFGAYQVKVFFL